MASEIVNRTGASRAPWSLPAGRGSTLTSMSRRAAVALLSLLAFAGCATGQAPIPPAYTQDELGERCARTGGWWRPSSPHSLFSGHCEYGGGIIR